MKTQYIFVGIGSECGGVLRDGSEEEYEHLAEKHGILVQYFIFWSCLCVYSKK